jgi:hypothetical protein
MINWLGHDIVEGAVVFRGGKQGTSSSFRVGVVELLREEKATARVQWKYTAGMRTIFLTEAYDYRDDRNYRVNGPNKAHTQKTNYPINDLVRLDDNTLKYLEQRDKLITAALHYKVPEKDFDQFEYDFNRGVIPEIN